jgi:hypothetical protein
MERKPWIRLDQPRCASREARTPTWSSGPKPERACIVPKRDMNEKVPKSGHLPEGLYSDTNKSWYMQRDHPCVYLSHCFSATSLVHKPDV